MRERSKLGIAIAAMIRMIATTINSSISEKPFCFFMNPLLQPHQRLRREFCTSATNVVVRAMKLSSGNDNSPNEGIYGVLFKSLNLVIEILFSMLSAMRSELGKMESW
jgi:hypothetical protein